MVVFQDVALSANTRINSMAEVWIDSQLNARGAGRPWTHLRALFAARLPPGRHNCFNYRPDAIPAVGQDTGSLLQELEQGHEAIARLHEARVI